MTPRVDLDWLAALCGLGGVSGDEGLVRRSVWAQVRSAAEEAWVDSLGTLVVTRHWRSGRGPRVVLAAHLDEVGLIVTGIDEAGLLRFDAVGGVDPRILPACALRVGPEGLAGAVALPPIHLTRKDAASDAPDPSDLRIDIGAANRSEAAVAVRPGDRAVFHSEPGRLGRLFRAKALDDRAGVAALSAVLQAAGNLDLPLAVCFTVQEEIGTRGAAAVARSLGADLCLVAETTAAADLPGVPPHRQGSRLGAGPVLTALDAGLLAHGPTLALLAQAAEREGLRYQWKRGATGGTDAARFQESGVPSAVVSLPCRYLHSPSSVMDPSDLDGLGALIAAWLLRVHEGGP